MESMVGRSIGRAIVLSLAYLVLGCQGEPDGQEPSGEVFACTYEVSFSSCQDPQGSPWVPSCITVGDESKCDENTRDHSERTDDCEYTTSYRAVDLRPGECVEAGEEPMGEGLLDGEACASLSQCESGLCVPQYYCTRSCNEDDDCQAVFDDGCCAGAGSLGYCLQAPECASLCPANSFALGLPTLCYCEDGFHWNDEGTQCIPPVSVGESCVLPTDCESGYCLAGFDAQGEYSSWCSTQCQLDGECSALVTAEQVEVACCGPTTDGPDACVIDLWCG